MSTDISPEELQDMELNKVLKKLLHERDIKVPQLSRATKVPIQTIHNWISGQKPRDVDQIQAVAKYFKVSLEYLLYGIECKPKSELFENYKDEINAGIFEVILRRTASKK